MILIVPSLPSCHGNFCPGQQSHETSLSAMHAHCVHFICDTPIFPQTRPYKKVTIAQLSGKTWNCHLWQD